MHTSSEDGADPAGPTSAAPGPGSGDAAPAGTAPVGQRELAELFEALPDMIIVLDDQARVRHANRTLLDTLGFRLEDLIGTSMFDYIHPDDLDYNANAWANRQAHPGEVGVIAQGRGRDAQGRWRAVEFVARSLSGDGDLPMAGLLVSMRELLPGDALTDRPAGLRSLIDRANDLVLLVDGDGLLSFANRRLTTDHGHDHEGLVGQRWTVVLHPDDRDEATDWLRSLVGAGDRATARARLRVEAPDGRISAVEWQATNHLADPLLRGVILNGRDVTHVVEMEQQLQRQNRQLAHAARHDPLTGLLNRQAFVEAVEQAIAERRTSEPGADVVVLFVDLDGFKAVNDADGHEAGDQVLAAIGGRLGEALGDHDLLARHGGDEFTVLLAGSPGPEAVDGVVASLVGRIADPVTLPHGTAQVGASVGVARAPAALADVDALLRDADRAMYGQKRRRG